MFLFLNVIIIFINYTKGAQPVSSSLQGCPQVQKFGARTAVTPLPQHQISRPLGSPRSCSLHQTPNPSAQGQAGVALGAESSWF